MITLRPILLPSLVGAILAAAASRALPLGEEPAQDASASGRSLYERALVQGLERLQSDLHRGLELFALRSDPADPWRVTSDAYEVRTNHSRLLGRKIARGLDRSLANFEELLGTSYRPSRRFVVIVQPTLEAYNTFGEDFGAEHSSFYAAFHAAGNSESAVGALYDPNWTRLGIWITHAAFHQYTSQALTAALPLWLEEGLAAYFAGFWDWDWTLRQYQEQRDRNGLIPLTSLLSASLADYTQRTDDRLIQLAVLVHYLENVREDTRARFDEEVGLVAAPFRDYVNQLATGGDFARSPVHALVSRQLRDLERDLRAAEL